MEEDKLEPLVKKELKPLQKKREKYESVTAKKNTRKAKQEVRKSN